MRDSEIMLDLTNSFFTICMSNYGNGKTISSSYLSLIMAKYNNRKIIMSNTPLFFLSSFDIEFIPLISTSQLTQNLKDIQLNMDELQTIANSRDSKSPRNSFVTEFSTDIRKYNQGVSSTTQYGNTIDDRLFDNSDVIIVPEWKYKQAKNTLRTDFNMYWNILFKETGINETIEIDIEIMKYFYNTKFKPFKMIVNHEEYIDKLKDTRKKEYVDDYINKCNEKIYEYENIFKLEMQGKY